MDLKDQENLVRNLFKTTKDLVGLSKDVIEASQFWCGRDEEKWPILRRIRTLAGLYVETYGKTNLEGVE